MNDQNKIYKNTLQFTQLGQTSPQVSYISPDQSDVSQLQDKVKGFKDSKLNNKKDQLKITNEYIYTKCIKVNAVKIVDPTPSKRFLYDSENSERQCEENLESQEYRTSIKNIEQSAVYCKEQQQFERDNQMQCVKEQRDKKMSEDQNSQNEEDIPNMNIGFFKASSINVLIQSDIPNNFTIKCLVRVTKGFFSPDTYDFYLEQDKKHLLRAQKSRIPLSGNFKIMELKKSKEVGRVFKNFTGTQYIVLAKAPNQNQQNQLAWISYSPNIFGMSGQRAIFFLKRKSKVPKTDRFSDLKQCWENGDRKKIQMFTSRNAEIKNGAYSLNFRGIIKMPSNKNTIIDDEDGKESMLFGKIRENIFSLHINSPLSLLQGFAIAISNLDSKLLVH